MFPQSHLRRRFFGHGRESLFDGPRNDGALARLPVDRHFRGRLWLTTNWTWSGVVNLSFENAIDFENRLLLDESALHLIGNRFQQVTHHCPAARLHEDFRGHARDKLQSGQPAAFLIRQRHSDREI